MNHRYPLSNFLGNTSGTKNLNRTSSTRLVDHLVPYSLALQNQLYGFACRSLAASCAAHVVRRIQHLLRRIRHRYREANAMHHRQVRKIIAQKSHRRFRHTRLSQNFLISRDLMWLFFKNKFDSQLPCAMPERRTLSPSNKSSANSRGARERSPLSIVSVKYFHFQSGSIRL